MFVSMDLYVGSYGFIWQFPYIHRVVPMYLLGGSHGYVGWFLWTYM